VRPYWRSALAATVTPITYVAVVGRDVAMSAKGWRRRRQDDVDALVDQIAGITLTHLSGMAARCNRDMVVRRNIDAVVMQIRREIAEVCRQGSG
jgi:hypothetical protein